jgi:hypothetical protein
VVGVEGLQALRPHRGKGISVLANEMRKVVETSGGLNLEVPMMAFRENINNIFNVIMV